MPDLRDISQTAQRAQIESRDALTQILDQQNTSHRLTKWILFFTVLILLLTAVMAYPLILRFFS